jgi:signal transduction histidine kinase
MIADSIPEALPSGARSEASDEPCRVRSGQPPVEPCSRCCSGDQRAPAAPPGADVAPASGLTLLAERERIGRELHDGVVQRLFATGLAMHTTAGLAGPGVVRDRMHEHLNEIDHAILEIRQAIFFLGNRRGDEVGLRREIFDLAEEASRLLGIEPLVRLEGPIDTAAVGLLQHHVVAVAREALANVVRHAQASHVELSIRAGTELTIEVVDDGCGLRHGPMGNGLRNLRQRAEQLGGHLEMTPGPVSGTVIRWAIPLR